MIASARGLAILGGIAVALLAVLLLAGSRARAPVDRSLLPGFDAARVTALVVSAGDRAHALTRAGSGWQVDGVAADPATVDAIFTALRGARWHRRASRATAGVDLGGAGDSSQPAARRSLRVGGTTFTIGAELRGTGQTWLVRSTSRGDEALLVDSWVATALTPTILALRVRHPLDCAGANLITATPDGNATGQGTVKIEGRRLVEPHALWLDEHVLSALADACARVEIVALADQGSMRSTAPGLRIAADASTLAETGTCEGGRALVDTSSGQGCVEVDALQGLRDALRTLGTAPHDAIDLRPLPIDPVELVLADGSVLELAGRMRIGDRDADPDAVRELVRALTTRGESAVARSTGAKPRAAIKATDRAGSAVTLELFADQTIGRAGEPGVIRVQPRDWDIITRPTAALRDATRWREDATTISSVTLDNVTYERGAVLGEWTREPAGAFDPAVVDALVESLATVRAPIAAPPRAIVHRLTVTITPPAGAPTTHAIEFAPPAGDGCPARVDGAPAMLPLPLCMAALALASQR